MVTSDPERSRYGLSRASVCRPRGSARHPPLYFGTAGDGRESGTRDAGGNDAWRGSVLRTTQMVTKEVAAAQVHKPQHRHSTNTDSRRVASDKKPPLEPVALSCCVSVPVSVPVTELFLTFGLINKRSEPQRRHGDASRPWPALCELAAVSWRLTERLTTASGENRSSLLKILVF